VVNVTDRTDVHVGLRAVKNFCCHSNFFLNSATLRR